MQGLSSFDRYLARDYHTGLTDQWRCSATVIIEQSVLSQNVQRPSVLHEGVAVIERRLVLVPIPNIRQ